MQSYVREKLQHLFLRTGSASSDFFLPFFAMSYGHRTFLAGWHFLSPSYFHALSLSHSLFTSCQAVPGAAIIPHPSSIPFFSIQE